VRLGDFQICGKEHYKLKMNWLRSI